MFRWQSAVCSVGLVATTLVAGLPPTMGAVGEPRTRVVLRDGANDIWSISDSEQPPGLAGTVPTADVTRAVVSHRRGALVVRLKFVDLKRVHPQQFIVGVSTPSRFLVGFVTASAARWAGTQSLIDYSRGELRCSGMAHGIDYAADRVWMRVPRACLGRPRWVRVSVQNALYKEVGGVFTELDDNPHNAKDTPGQTARLRRAG